MADSTRSWIEEQRAASQKDALEAKEKARQESAERVALLRPRMDERAIHFRL